MKIKELSELICKECKEEKDRVCFENKRTCEYYKNSIQTYFTLKRMEESQKIKSLKYGALQ